MVSANATDRRTYFQTETIAVPQQWEYDVRRINLVMNKPSVPWWETTGGRDLLNLYGRFGWEVVGSPIVAGTDLWMTFKRPKLDSNGQALAPEPGEPEPDRLGI